MGGKYISKGGPGSDETTKVLDDGRGIVWLAADMTPGGLNLALFKSIPYGKRPLIAVKANDVDGSFDKMNWAKALERVEVTMGGPHIKQRCAGRAAPRRQASHLKIKETC